MNIDRKDMIVVSVMPCSKKYERQRKFIIDGNPDVDITITTRELARLIKLSNMITCQKMKFDAPGWISGALLFLGNRWCYKSCYTNCLQYLQVKN